MGVIVIVAYKPRPGQESGLLAEMKTHVPILRQEGLATDRPATLMKANDGTIIEVFEWVSADAIAKAHTNPAVQAMWGRFNAVCTYEPLVNLEECKQMFAGFEAVEL